MKRQPSVSLGDLWGWGIFLITLFLSTLFLTWHLSAKGNFFYPIWYSVIGIDKHIATFAPQNRYIKGFETTSKGQRFRLFAAIVDEIHNQGQALDQLTFIDGSTGKVKTFLTQDEVIHLKDVANLVDKVQIVGVASIGLTLVLAVVLLKRKRGVPELRRYLTPAAIAGACLLCALFIIGPGKVFEQLHIWVFPDDHPWFFFYQDSLMSTFMKAPDLFGAIAAQLFITALMLYAGLLYAIRRCNRGI